MGDKRNKQYIYILLNLIERKDVLNCISIFIEDIVKELINGEKR